MDKPFNGGTWKVLSVVISIALVAAGAFGAKLWDIGMTASTRGELAAAVEKNEQAISEKYQALHSRIVALESFQTARADQLHRIEAQTAVLDALLKEMRAQYNQFRNEIRQDIVDIKALIQRHTQERVK